MISKLLQLLFNKTINSPAFGIGTMVLVGAYVAIGSGGAGRSGAV